MRKNNYQKGSDFPIFQWQEGFDDQLIRDKEQLKSAIFYLKKQVLKHELPENKFLFISDNLNIKERISAKRGGNIYSRF